MRPHVGPEKNISCQLFHEEGAQRGQLLGAGLPAPALRFLPSLWGRRERGVCSSSWSGNEKKEGGRAAPLHPASLC